jgi:hypothetical protein
MSKFFPLLQRSWTRRSTLLRLLNDLLQKRSSVRLFVCSSLALAFLGCSNVSRTSSHQAPDASFIGRTTFRFVPDKSLVAAQAVSNSAYWREQIGQNIVAALNAKGYRFFPTRQTDFLVAYHIVLKEGESITTLDNYSGYNLSPGEETQADLTRFQNPKRPGEAATGTLIIDIVDPRQRRILWRGYTTAAFDRQQPTEKLRARLKMVVDKTLAGLPSRKRR